MSKKNKKNRQHQNPKVVLPANRGRWIVAGVFVVGIIGGYLAFRPPHERPAPNTKSDSSAATAQNGNKTKASTPPSAPAKYERLIGRWLRPDGGYILEIRSATEDGKLEAGYFNPGSINVARAEWRREDGGLQVFVELRDKNYPGSTYTLEYSAAEDRMAGNYYQAAQGENFPVEFVREK